MEVLSADCVGREGCGAGGRGTATAAGRKLRLALPEACLAPPALAASHVTNPAGDRVQPQCLSVTHRRQCPCGFAGPSRTRPRPLTELGRRAQAHRKPVPELGLESRAPKSQLSP